MATNSSEQDLAHPESGGVEGTVAGGEDLAERDQRAMASLLRQREGFYQAVLESLAEGVIITNAESRILHVNGRMVEISGYSRDELIGKVSYELLSPPENWPVMRERLRERLSGKEEYYEHELVRKDGATHWIAVKATPYRNAQGEIVGTVGAISCIERQKSLERENEYLQDEIRREQNFGQMVGRSPALTKVLEQIRMVAPTGATVLVLGESGTGKELVARAIHENSDRRKKALVRVNCASIPQELFESEFFGHVRGAFTGAVKDRVGRFELADGGTLFLDEVGEIPLDLQSKLLRVLQEGQFEKVGEERTRSVDVRLIAATNRSLAAEVKTGRFREDLYYRLSVFPIELPPLRERRTDIRSLAEHFLAQSAARLGLGGLRLTSGQVKELEAYDWPGNVRELQNVIERAAILARGGPLRFQLQSDREVARRPVQPVAPHSLAGAADTVGNADLSLDELKVQERRLIERALEKTGGKIYGSDGAAKLLGLKPTTLASRLKRLRLAGRID